MAASEVEICNLALSKLGHSTKLITLDDDDKAGRAMKLWYAPTRKAELRRRKWKFSIKRQSIAALISTPDHGFSYEYQLPTDNLRILEVGSFYVGPDMSDYRNGSTAIFQIENGKILTSLAAPLPIRYIKDETDTALFDPAFDDMLACRIAYEACEELTQSDTKKEMLERQYNKSLREAARANAIEADPESLPDNSWLLSRMM